MQGRAITLPIYLLRKGDRASYFTDLGGALPLSMLWVDFYIWIWAQSGITRHVSVVKRRKDLWLPSILHLSRPSLWKSPELMVLYDSICPQRKFYGTLALKIYWLGAVVIPLKSMGRLILLEDCVISFVSRFVEFDRFLLEGRHCFKLGALIAILMADIAGFSQ